MRAAAYVLAILCVLADVLHAVCPLSWAVVVVEVVLILSFALFIKLCISIAYSVS